MFRSYNLWVMSPPRFHCATLLFYIGELNRDNIVNPLINLWRFVFSDSNKLTLFITKVFGYRPGNNSSAFNVSTHEGAGTFQALANKELTSPKANWASGL
ncbi:hypothetical protein H8356DRAFT_1359138 [Neocallimastix lanati (nom. inval.)]|nr:hypothetical protein H8356DRAFT_1359138 [Neocallimastix sp. JGI-2020a]